MTDDWDIDRLASLETEWFAAGAYRGRPSSPPYVVVPGTIPVMVSAPHAVTHVRGGRTKPSDDFTGAMALLLAESLGCHAIVAARTTDADPNWDPLERSPYKQALVDHVRQGGIALVLDLHGMAAASPSLVEVGSARGATTGPMTGIDLWARAELEARLASERLALGKRVVLNERMMATSPNTVASVVARETGAAALQVELSTYVRVPRQQGLRSPDGVPMRAGERGRSCESQARRDPNPTAVCHALDALAAIVREGTRRVEAMRQADADHEADADYDLE